MAEITPITKPYVTVGMLNGLHTPVMMANGRAGPTVADLMDGHESFEDAKRQAVQWAKSLNLEYRHGA